MGKAEEIPIICLRPLRRMFKLKSQPPRSLTGLKFMWRWGFLPPLYLHWPLAPTVSQCNRPPQGLTSSTFRPQKHMHVLHFWALQVLRHIVKQTKTRRKHKNTRTIRTKALARVRFCALLVFKPSVSLLLGEICPKLLNFAAQQQCQPRWRHPIHPGRLIK